MKKYKTRLTKMLVDLCCDVCGQSCKNEHIVRDEECSPVIVPDADCEYATLSANWGYYSRKDGESYHLDLCEDCFDDVVRHIHALQTQKRESKNNEQRDT